MITAIFSFIPTVFLIFLFKQTKNRKFKFNKIGKGIDLIEINEEGNRKNKRTKLLLPWWFKIIEYLLSFSLMACSIFLTILKGF